MTFIPTQPPDDNMGRRYSKAFKYVFVALRRGEDLTQVDPGSGSPLTGNDNERYVSLTLPQQLSFHEPYATAVTVMQDGGKVIESKGQVLKMATISGTTGFLPPTNKGIPFQPPYGRLVPNIIDLDGQLGAISGYLAFQKLRYLFRYYGDQRRLGNLDLEMHFFDYKNDDFWRIEPESFDMTRSSRRPMSYDYNIAFKCIEYSDANVTRSPDVGTLDDPTFGGTAKINTGSLGGVLSKVAGGAGTAINTGVLASIGRAADMVTSGLDFVKHCDAVVAHSFQIALSALDNVVGFFQNIHDTVLAQLELVPALLALTTTSLTNLFDTIEEFAPDNIKQELNAWALEVTRLADNMAVQVSLQVGSQSQRDVRDTDVRFSQSRMRQGAVTDLMQEPPGSTGSLDANPFIGASGLALTTDVDKLANGTQYATYVINTGEDIYALARRLLGSITKFMDLVLINRLESPYIVADVTQKPSNTLAWGEYILVPASAGQGSPIGDGVDTLVYPSASGTVSTASLPSQLIDNTATWLPDQWIGYTVTATTGGFVQTLVAIGNTTDGEITLNGNFTITITPGVTTYSITYSTFNPRRPLTPDARAYGTDFLVVFGNDGRCDFSIGASGDLASVTGLDNFFQAIKLRARCPLGEHPFHKTYGLPAPIGRPATDDVFVLNTFFLRRSLLSDPRVGKVRNVQLNLTGDTLMMSAEVQPVDSRVARPITIQVGK